MRDFISYVATPTALDADGSVKRKLPLGGHLLINGDLATGGVATFGEQQRVTLYSAADLRALTFTVYGTQKSVIRFPKLLRVRTLERLLPLPTSRR